MARVRTARARRLTATPSAARCDRRRRIATAESAFATVARGIRLACYGATWNAPFELERIPMVRLTAPAGALAAAALLLGATAALPSPDSAAFAASASSRTGHCMAASVACANAIMHRAHSKPVPVEKNAPHVPGHPLTAVVVTQCNLLVAVYLTMPDGRLLRYDSTASVPADRLVQMAYTATRSERVEVSCNDRGAAGYERHDPL